MIKRFFAAIAWVLPGATLQAQQVLKLQAQQASEFNISIADKTEETGLLEKGQWQVEGGFLLNRYRHGASSDIGQLFIRHSISDKLEVRLLTEEGRGRDRYISETVQSTYPLAIGSKLKILENHSFLPVMTLVGYINLPFTAHSKQQSHYWSPMIFMAFQHQLSDKWSIDYNAGAQQEGFGTTWAALLNGSVHYRVTEKLESFVEYYAQYEPAGPPQHNIGGGLSLEITTHIAVYLAGGSSVFAKKETNSFYTAGIAARF